MLKSNWLRIVACMFAYIAAVASRNILLTNDDGWADAQIRAQYQELTDAGFSVVLSCPSENMSGTGSDTATPTVLTESCEYDTCPVGSPPEGFDASNPRLNYVNAYPVDAARYGIQTLSPKFFGTKPDFVVSGPNIWNNLGTTVLGSGTVGAACEAAKEGLPATAFSGGTGAQISYTTLDTDPTASSSESSWIYSALTVHYVQTILALDLPGIPLLPPGIIVSVNYPDINDCMDPSDYKWVFSRNMPNTGEEDVWTCGSTVLPVENDVVAAGCYNSVSVLNATSKTDVDAILQAEVYTRLFGLPFTCIPSS